MITNSGTKENNTKKDLFSLVGQIIISGKIETITGLHIGGTESSLSIGGVDLLVIRNATDGKPYIPGSSLKGKMRSILEKIYTPGGGELKKVGNSKIFKCDPEKYNTPEKRDGIIFHLFGITPEDLEKKEDIRVMPTRLIVRDAKLSKESSKSLEESNYVDLPYTQAKTEVIIDRITSSATPRTVERVPAGIFFDYEFVLNIYDPPDLEDNWIQKFVDTLKEGMELLEHDYLGGMGSRGYGQIQFNSIKVDITSYVCEKKKIEENILSFINWANEKTQKNNSQ